MKSRTQIKQAAKEAFRAQYGNSVLIYLLYFLLVSAVSGITFGAGALLLVPIFTVGLALTYITVFRRQEAQVGQLFVPFNQFGRNVGGILWMQLWVFIWSLLFFIPGIVKSFSYSMTPYILADCPNVPATKALRMSMAMTNGHKGKIFVLQLSFIGWILLSGLTFGILAIVYVGPYMEASMAGMYDELKRNAIGQGLLASEDFM